MTYTMDFNFPYAHVVVKGLDEEALAVYSEKMQYEVPFEVTSTVKEWNATITTKNYIINPNLVTYVEVSEEQNLL